MKRFTWSLVALSILAFSLPAAAQSVTIVLNGQTMNFSQPPIERAGRVFVPLRGIFEQLGASVVYENGQINATAYGRAVSLSIGSTQAMVAGQPVVIDVPPFIVGSTTFVPLRFISQALGASVNWDDSTSTVTIAGRAPGPPPPGYPPQPGPRPVYLVSRWPNGTIENPTPTLRFAFNRPVMIKRLRVWVDGQRVMADVQRDGPAITIDMPWRLERGPHRVRVAGMTAGGVPFDLNWSFARD